MTLYCLYSPAGTFIYRQSKNVPKVLTQHGSPGKSYLRGLLLESGARLLFLSFLYARRVSSDSPSTLIKMINTDIKSILGHVLIKMCFGSAVIKSHDLLM